MFFFLTVPKTNLNFSVTFIFSSPNAFNSDLSKILSFGNELNDKFHTHIVTWAFSQDPWWYSQNWNKQVRALQGHNSVKNTLTYYNTIPHFDALKIYSCRKHCEKRRNGVENFVGKGEIACYKHLSFNVFAKDFYCRHITRGTWAPASLHRPDFSVTVKRSF